jgi:hypothetical protein
MVEFVRDVIVVVAVLAAVIALAVRSLPALDAARAQHRSALPAIALADSGPTPGPAAVSVRPGPYRA